MKNKTLQAMYEKMEEMDKDALIKLIIIEMFQRKLLEEKLEKYEHKEEKAKS